jgi:hypothetical protein
MTPLEEEYESQLQLSLVCAVTPSKSVIDLVLSMRALSLVPESCTSARILLSHQLRLAFISAVRVGISHEPQELGLYPKVLHSPGHRSMMLQGLSVSGRAMTETDGNQSQLKPVSTASLLLEIQSSSNRVFRALRGPLFKDSSNSAERGHAGFTSLQTLRLLWYTTQFGMQGQWSNIRYMSFPDQQETITESMCKDEWDRLVYVALGTVATGHHADTA